MLGTEKRFQYKSENACQDKPNLPLNKPNVGLSFRPRVLKLDPQLF